MKSSGITGVVGIVAGSRSESFRRVNAHLLSGPISPEIKAVAPKEKRLRQSTKPVLNELEKRFESKLRFETSPAVPLAQAIRLELARGIWYKPDFFVIHDGQPIFFEVKGPKSFRGGLENLKVAARVHAWAKFYLVWEANDVPNDWTRQEILP